jgi:UDP-N-acetylmuramoyl-tripeptide--D-alanyl-D-alanine ligase
MSTMNYSKSCLLAILQQAEYELDIWQKWLRQSRTSEQTERLQSLQPARWTTKLRLLSRLANIYSLFFPWTTALSLAVKTVQPFENLLTAFIVMLANHKLRRLQKNGLIVIAIAGSYGKTSVKHILSHVLSHQWFTLMSPASYNTPLGLATTILKDLTGEHKLFLAELGEYQPGDIHRLLSWIRPQYGVLTPIGFAHGDRFASKQAMSQTLAEMTTSKFAPNILLVDAKNRESLPSSHQYIWYGDDDSDYRLNELSQSITGTVATLHTPQQHFSAKTRLLGSHQLRNALPAVALTHTLGGSVPTAVNALAYAPHVPRRLAVTTNLNGTTFIDNSYNTNPASWKEMSQLLEQLHLPHLAIITAGFVELEPALYPQQHEQLAQDLIQYAEVIGIINSNTNQDLITALHRAKQSLVVGDSLDEVLEKIGRLNHPLQYLWVEGGSRELYQ